MDLTISIWVFWILSYCLCDSEARKYEAILSVPNGGRWGTWGQREFCPMGHATGFALKVQPPQSVWVDDTGMNGIRLECTDGTTIESKSGRWGYWTETSYCPKGNLIAFVLNVQGSRGLFLDDTAANNIKFYCDSGTTLIGNAYEHGLYGEWSEVCSVGAICGIQAKTEAKHGGADKTALNDVKFFCCD
ncbi:vitelline membrane outer layer protein 1-like [Candoia aspera]|uniref:vitelline membrane outer layer protein 1-like n=1 Tax=Candoia aspera TaxID=51853 RepID=UPI002FD83A95